MLEVRRSRDRGYDDHGWLKSWYTFVYADYYDPEHVDFGPLKVMNEDRVMAGKAYPHQNVRDSVVLTYLIEGELRHQDSLGNELLLQAGSLQCLNAGTGVRHVESNASAEREAHLLHICIAPARTGGAPSYEQRLFSSERRRGALQLLASPQGDDGSLALHQDARIFGGLFHEAERTKLDLRRDRRAFLHVIRGSIAVNETRLNTGDGVKINPPGDIVIQHGRDAEIIVFEVAAQAGVPRRKAIRPTQV
ncbi:MAG: pirin family protein [Proteobacteria bacterium]|nr:pirin family protein [Pseudomonadota bacterium]